MVCKQYGTDDVEVFRCDAKGCGLFYHENCLDVYNVDVHLMEEEIPIAAEDAAVTAKGEGALDGRPTTATVTTKTVRRPKFRCPAHQCWTCSGGPPPAETNICSPVATCTPVTPTPGSRKKRGRPKSKSGDSALALWGTKKGKLFVS